jgi:hypothetical protein
VPYLGQEADEVVQRGAFDPHGGSLAHLPVRQGR